MSTTIDRSGANAPATTNGPPDGDEPRPNAVTRLSLGVLEHSLARPKRTLVVAGLITILLAALFVRVEIDTDPENMLASDNPARIENRELRETFGGGEMIVVGLFAADTVLTPERLEGALAFHDRLSEVDGVDETGLVSIRSAIDGPSVPAPDSFAESLADDPLLGGNVLSADGDTFAFFVALDAKSDALDVRDAANAILDADPALSGLERHIGGLPLAQEAFGAQMFIQMAIFAPLAGLAIFALMMLFFRRLVLVGPAMVLAMLSVVWAMGLLIGTGNTLHIMSSMIPIFLMPIAILDAIHVISEFFDRYAATRDRLGALRGVYDELVQPIAFTTITTGVGFAALALTPIPPVRVFGIFVAIGVVIAWLATLTVLPALLMLVRESSIERAVGTMDRSDSRFARFVRVIPAAAVRHRGAVLSAFGIVMVAAVPMLTTIQVNDNPVNWFRSSHEVRVATERLNDELPGTFGASLVLRSDGADLLAPESIAAVAELQGRLDDLAVVGTASSYVDLVDGATGSDAAQALDVARERSALTSTLITDDDSQANLRLQLRSGDNQAMQTVLDAADAALATTPLPDGISASWAGESHLNLVWQDEMVAGMIVGFLVTLGVIVVLLAVLFRSVRWALLGIAPVLWTIVVVYGVIGLIGKDFDMPIAVLSTMVLGIGVDFAIHFVQRYRHLTEHASPTDALREFGEEPARALTRNAAVIAIGFTPLLFSSLTPYVIVAIFLASLITLSWFTTLVALPAAVSGRSR
ncbi:MAG: RND family transporter [Ilumatobacter sp.]